jgi:hypothetical protein
MHHTPFPSLPFPFIAAVQFVIANIFVWDFFCYICIFYYAL